MDKFNAYIREYIRHDHTSRFVFSIEYGGKTFGWECSRDDNVAWLVSMYINEVINHFAE